MKLTEGCLLGSIERYGLYRSEYRCVDHQGVHNWWSVP